MVDQSHLDLKYFIDRGIYNCPFCNRRHVSYSNRGRVRFDWSNAKTCFAWFINCDSCQKVSMHLTYQNLEHPHNDQVFRTDADLDSAFFYSVPTSFFVVDHRIPPVLRNLITEAEGCQKMNYLVGASACARKAIYELLALQKTEGQHYDDKTKDLQSKNPGVDPIHFEVLGHVKDMTSDHVHEQSWDAWDSHSLRLFLETLKAVLHEIYVVPAEKLARAEQVRALKAKFGSARAGSEQPPEAPSSDKP